MEPVNYSFGTADPYKMAMGGFQSGLDASAQRGDMAAQAQGMQLAQNQDGRAQQQLEIQQQQADQQAVLFGQQQADLVRQQQAQADLAALTALGSSATGEDFAAFIGAYPEIAQEAAQAWTVYSSTQQDNYLKFGAQVYTAIQGGNIDAAKALLKEHQAAAENSGNQQEADMAKGMLMQLDLQPGAAAMALRLWGDASTGGQFSKLVDGAMPQGAEPVTRPLTDPAERARWGIPAMDTRPYSLDPKEGPKLIGGAAGTTVVNNLGGETAFDKQLGTADADTIAGATNAGIAAKRSTIQVGQLEEILAAAPEGAAGFFVQAAGRLGLPMEGADNVQAATALISALVPAQRPPGSGTMSDADLELFKQSLPQIMNQPGGNKKIIDTIKAIAQYDIDGANIALRVRLPDGDPEKLTRAEALKQLQERPNPLQAALAPIGGAKPSPARTFKERGDLAPADQAVFDQIIARNSGKSAAQWDAADMDALRRLGVIP